MSCSRPNFFCVNQIFTSTDAAFTLPGQRVATKARYRAAEERTKKSSEIETGLSDLSRS
jgi:hypothetical protein